MIITAQAMGQYGRIRHFVIIHFHNAKPVAFISAPLRLLLSRCLSPAIFSGKPLQYLKIIMTVPFQQCCLLTFYACQIICQRNCQMAGPYTTPAAHHTNCPDSGSRQRYQNRFIFSKNKLRTIPPFCPNH